ncbi:hypothetical protein BVG16_31895 [Paenibacillus selenitireducens]|uniref:Uncharacterized protein n=1 Tax=Paenibacillus selenitireducens TaxID=1324314 RepID=A0A1T2WYZ1_9BACL|nr:hypothetical protein [Paenibacillus selenitireducens]OPA72832.1 hypothetical protein BVG16_31895 [Paenibacillus selenitireducens]
MFLIYRAAERPEYKGNMVEGIALASNNPVVGGTVKKVDLRLVRGIDGLIRLSVYSPAIDAAVSPLFTLDDMEGGPKENRPLTTADVGPGGLWK